MNEQRAVTTWIPICCVCHQVRDDRQSHDCPTQNGFDAWMSLRSFLRHYCVTRGTYQLTHTYCLHCMERLVARSATTRKEDRAPAIKTLQEKIRPRVVRAVGPAYECDLDYLVSRGSNFS